MCAGARGVQEPEWATAWGGLGRQLRSRHLGQSVTGVLWVREGEVGGGLEGGDLRGQRENWKIVLLGSLSRVPTLSGDPSVHMCWLLRFHPLGPDGEG